MGLAILQIFILVIEMLITFVLMRQIDTEENVIKWIVGISILSLILIVVIDFIRILVFACIYASKQPNYKSAKCAAFFFLGNFHIIALKQLQIEI